LLCCRLWRSSCWCLGALLLNSTTDFCSLHVSVALFAPCHSAAPDTKRAVVGTADVTRSCCVRAETRFRCACAVKILRNCGTRTAAKRHGRDKSDLSRGRRPSGHSEDAGFYPTSRERATGAPHEPAKHPPRCAAQSAAQRQRRARPFLLSERRAGARLHVPPSLAGPRCARAPGQRVRAPGAAVGVLEEPAAACDAAAAQRGCGGRARASHERSA